MTNRQKQYRENKSAKVGTEITCPVCGERFTKKQYSQAFCCPYCKDKFWNDKGDRHSAGYYENYDAKHPDRMLRRRLYGGNIIVSISGELSPRHLDEIHEKFTRDSQQIYDY